MLKCRITRFGQAVIADDGAFCFAKLQPIVTSGDATGWEAKQLLPLLICHGLE